MRTVTIEYRANDGFGIEDSDGQYVDAEFERDIAFYISRLHGESEVVCGSSHRNDAMAEALSLMGVL